MQAIPKPHVLLSAAANLQQALTVTAIWSAFVGTLAMHTVRCLTGP